jgi:V8-like Glu-specific endopeptidase
LPLAIRRDPKESIVNLREFSYAGLICCAWTAAAVAQDIQPNPLPSTTIPMVVDSGMVQNQGDEPAPVFATEVLVPGGQWLRLWFDAATLAGTPGIDGSYLRIISTEDGAEHILDGDHIENWSMSSAYMNGDSVILELWAYPNTGPNRVAFSEVMVGDPPDDMAESICDGGDDRVLSYDTRQGRLSTGCTAWLINHDNSANRFLTAGHCISNGTSGAVVFFNVPLSTSSGGFRAPHPVYQYPVQNGSIQSTGSGGVGNDLATFQTNNNSNTGMSARVAQNAAYNLANAAPSASNQTIRVTGYGIRNGSVSPAIPQTWNTTQKTHTGPLTQKNGNTSIRYRPDTTGGNSGSPVVLESSGLAIGIHTHGGCTSTGGSNAGSAIEHPTLQSYLTSPQGTNSLFAPLAEIETTFASDNSGSTGGAVYFDVSVGYAPLIVRAIELNTTAALSTEFTVSIYRTPGTASGKQTNAAQWTLVGQGSGLATGRDNATRVVLNSSFTLDRNQSHGIAIVLNGAGHAYTNGTGSNQTYSSPQATLTAGSATNAPFSGSVFNDRVFNGKLCYQPDWISGNLFGNDNTSTLLSGSNIKAMGFRMPAGQAMQLGQVALNLTSITPDAQPVVRIYNTNIFTGGPSTIRTTLSNPPLNQGTATYYFTPQTNIQLLASNSYWLVVHNTGSGSFNWRASSPPIIPGGNATHTGALFSLSSGPNPPSSTDSSSFLNSYAVYTNFPEPCLGDIADSNGVVGNSDGQVDFGDLLALFGLAGPCPGGTPGCTGDIADSNGVVGNSDGQVDFGDLLALFGLAGPCP